MIKDIALKRDINSKIGEGREYLVSQYIKKRYNWEILPSTFTDDVVYKIDIIAMSLSGFLVYIQVKGFHNEWRTEKFPQLVDKAIKDKALGYAAYVNKRGKIYFRKLI